MQAFELQYNTIVSPNMEVIQMSLLCEPNIQILAVPGAVVLEDDDLSPPCGRGAVDKKKKKVFQNE